MIRLAMIALTWVVTTAGSLAAQTPDSKPPVAQIQWAADSQQALGRAQSKQQPIVAYVTGDRCSHCRKMERTTWRDPRIVRRMGQEFVPLKINVKQQREVAAQLGIKSLPTTILYTPQGKVIAGATGYLSTSQLQTLLATARRPQVALQPHPAAATNAPTGR